MPTPNHHIFVERCLRNPYIKCGGELSPKPQKQQFSTPPAVKIVAILSMMSFSGKPLGTSNYDLKVSKFDFSYLYHHTFVEKCLRNHFVKFGGEMTTSEPKN